jgi:crotonobetainyl-CoA:carnitine CoA-transferase CaiB-like acyl-CoA transferase
VQALKDVRVVDIAGPFGAYCSKLLCDQGAAVTVGTPADGGLLRRLPPFDADGASWFHAYYDAGKEEVDLDAALARIDDADVVIAPAGPDAHDAGDWVARGGVWCAITAFGLDGPYAGYAATQLTAHASGGHVYDQGPAEGPPVSMPGIAVLDEAGTHAAICIVAALRRRAAGGQVIDVAVQEVLAGEMHALQRFALAGVVNRRGAGAVIPPAGTWECSDGLIELQVWQPNQWDAFVALLGSPPELSNPAWRDRAERQKAADAIRPVVAAALKPAKTLEIWKAAQAARIPSSPVNTLRDFLADEQVAARGFVVDDGEHRTIGRGYRIETAPVPVGSA